MLRQSIAILLLVAGAAAATSAIRADEPETVMITLQVKRGAETALADVLARHYAAAGRLKLVIAEAPHVTLRSADEADRRCFVEILTWRDAAVPDHAPAEILALWREMSALVEPRGDRPGIDIVPMIAVAPVTTRF